MLSIWLWVFPSWEAQVYLWMLWCVNILLLTCRFFDVANLTVLTPLCLLAWCGPSIPAIGLKISSLSNYALKFPNRIFMWYLGKWLKTCPNYSYKLCFESSLFSSLGACTFSKTIVHQPPLRAIYDILSLTHCCLNCWYCFVCAKFIFRIDNFNLFFHRKNILPCSYRALLSCLRSCSPTKFNLFLTNLLATVVSEPDLYRLLHCIYQIWCPFSLAEVVPKNQSRPEAHLSIL